MERLYRDIFIKAESCSREGTSGTVINTDELDRQKKVLSTCVGEIISAIEQMIKQLSELDINDISYSKALLFADALVKYASKYNLLNRFDTNTSFKALLIFVELGKKISNDANEHEVGQVDIAKALDILDPMREFCFSFCLASIDAFAPKNSTETLINKAVVYDAIKDGISLSNTCDVINSLDSITPISDYHLLWECGTLHYKICKYSEAIMYFKRFLDQYIANENIQQRDDDRQGHILDACYRLAYCYEFSGEIGIALYIFSKIFIENDRKAYIEFKIDSIESILYKLPDNKQAEACSYDIYIQLAKVPNDIANKNNTELLHGISHLINELVLYYEGNSPHSLLRIANRLMYAAASRRDVFFTCLGTNHSENKEFGVAISIFKFLLEKNIFDETDRLHLRLEVVFYLAHAYLFSGDYDEAKKYLKEFGAYCNILNDREGFSHLAIYETYLMLMQASSHFSLNQYELKHALLKLESNKPSLYTTKKVQEEWEQLHSFVLAVLTIKELIDGQIETNIALKTAIESITLCVCDEINKQFDLRYSKIDGKYIYRISSRKSDKTIYFLCDADIDLSSLLFSKSITKKSFKSSDTIELGASQNGQSIIVLATMNEDDIYWATEKVETRDVRWYISSDVTEYLTDSHSNIRNVIEIDDINIENVIRYAYFDFVYNLSIIDLLRPKVFLGMTPTRMTQLYKFNVRKINGLHDREVLSYPNMRHSGKLDDVWNHNILENKIDVSTSEESFVFKNLLSGLKNSPDSKKLIAAFYIPKRNKHWHYRIDSSLFVTGFPRILFGGEPFKDVNVFTNEFSNVLMFKDPYLPEKRELKELLKREIVRTDFCDCDVKHRVSCCFKIYELQPSGQSYGYLILQKIMGAISLFDANLNTSKSLLALKLDNSEYFIAVYNDSINKSDWKRTICDMARIRHGFPPLPGKGFTSSVPSERAIVPEEDTKIYNTSFTHNFQNDASNQSDSKRVNKESETPFTLTGGYAGKPLK